MAETDVLLASLNSGEISRFALARIDLAKLKVACETQTNFLPHVLGPCTFRPGLGYIVHTRSDLAGQFVEFVFDETTNCLLVLTPLFMNVLIGGVYLTRPAVTAAIANGTFPTNLSGWTNVDEAGAATVWIAAGSVGLAGTGTNYAQIEQQVTCNEPNVEHALRVVITRGTVRVQIGTIAGDNSYFDATLAPGSFSLAFTPTGNFWVRLGANTAYTSYLAQITIETAGVVNLPTPWDVADLSNVFYDQSGDVVFVAGGKTIQQRRIERRASDSRSWGVAQYLADDGPFRLQNISEVTLTPSATTGAITLTASRPMFKTGHVDALFRGTHPSQSATAALVAQNTFTGAVRVSGLGTARTFAVTVDGTFAATVSLQRSLGAVGSWRTIETYTAATTKTFDDKLDNQIVFYRLGIETGNYTSGTANCNLSYSGSVQTGICRLRTISSTTSALADVLQEFGAATATSDWSEGEWSAYRGYPAAVALHDGRLFWQTGLKLHGSVSDAFHSFDDTVTGDSAPINRVLATGGGDGGRWMVSALRMLVGTASQEMSIRSDALDAPLTPLNLTARACSTRGSARVRALKVDTTAIFVDLAGRVFKLAYELQQGDYRSSELTRLKQEMCAVGVKSVAVQRRPDTRVWFVLTDGTCAVMTYEEGDDVVAWTPFVTPGLSGLVERVAVLPAAGDDEVYFIVLRGASRFIEKLAKRSEAGIGLISKCMDSHLFAAGPVSSVAMAHLPNGTSVVAWANGVPLPGPFTVALGAVPLGGTFSNVTVGLAYTGQIKTAKLAYGAEHGTALEMKKRVSRVGLVMADVGWKGIRIGRNFTTMTGMPATYKGRVLTATETLASWDDIPPSFNGGWDTDARVCVQVTSPYPATIMAMALHMATNETVDEPAPRNPG